MFIFLTIMQWAFILVFVVRIVYWVVKQKKRGVEYPAYELTACALLSCLFAALKW